MWGLRDRCIAPAVRDSHQPLRLIVGSVNSTRERLKPVVCLATLRNVFRFYCRTFAPSPRSPALSFCIIPSRGGFSHRLPVLAPAMPGDLPDKRRRSCLKITRTDLQQPVRLHDQLDDLHRRGTPSVPPENRNRFARLGASSPPSRSPGQAPARSWTPFSACGRGRRPTAANFGLGTSRERKDLGSSFPSLLSEQAQASFIRADSSVRRVPATVWRP